MEHRELGLKDCLIIAILWCRTVNKNWPTAGQKSL